MVNPYNIIVVINKITNLIPCYNGDKPWKDYAKRQSQKKKLDYVLYDSIHMKGPEEKNLQRQSRWGFSKTAEKWNERWLKCMGNFDFFLHRVCYIA
jgi:hypothetical protein